MLQRNSRKVEKCCNIAMRQHEIVTMLQGYSVAVLQL